MKKYKKLPLIKIKLPNRNTSTFNFRQVLLPAAGAMIGNIVAPGIGGLLTGVLIGGALAQNTKDKKFSRVPVFYSFHFDNDVMRVQQIRNIGAIEGNSAVNANEWEQLKRSGKTAVQNWIDNNLKYK